MASEVSISNLGLAGLGHKSFIQSMDEASVEARYAKLFFDPTRRSTLRAHPWNFATSRVDLALLGDGPRPWTYTYALPTACLKARYIVPSVTGIKIPFELGLNTAGTARVIHTNEANATLVYTSNVSNVDLFDPLFSDTLAANLSARFAPVIAPSKSQEMLARYVSWMRAATAADAGEGEAEVPPPPEWLDARLSAAPATYTREET